MRKFYENWQMLDAKPMTTTDEEAESTIVIVDSQDKGNQASANSTIAIVESVSDVIDIYQAIRIPNTKEFPVEDFFKIPFTHHIRIIEGTDSIPARYY